MRPLPILLYHSVDDEPRAEVARWAIGVRRFQEHLAVIRDGGWTTVTMSSLFELMRSGAELPERIIAITFDDGFEDVLTRAVEMMHGMVATSYVTTGYLRDGREKDVEPPGRMLEGRQLPAIAAAGWEVGVHGHRHCALDAVPRRAAETDIRDSKRRVEGALGQVTTSFAYPFGYHDRFVQAVVRNEGFTHAAGVKNVYSHALDDRWGLARITVEHDMTATWLSRRLQEPAPRVAPKRERPATTGWRAARRVRSALHGIG